MTGVIVVVCAAFGLAVSEANTEIKCLHTKGMQESAIIFSVEVAGQAYNQTNKFVYLGGTSTTMPTCPSGSTGAYATHGAASGSIPSSCTADRAFFLSSKCGHQEPRYSIQYCTVASRDPARVPLRHAAPSPAQLSDSLHRLAKEQSHRPPDFLSEHSYQDEK